MFTGDIMLVFLKNMFELFLWSVIIGIPMIGIILFVKRLRPSSVVIEIIKCIAGITLIAGMVWLSLRGVYEK